jgi:TRAP-type C4-dicarboxylate transport system substrate-binding protein
LSADERKIIQSAADEAKAEERKTLQAQETEAVERLRKAMQVNEVSAAELERMREKVKPVVDRFASEIGEGLSKQVSDELARLRAN